MHLINAIRWNLKNEVTHSGLTLAGHSARYSLTTSIRKSGFNFSKYSTPRGKPCRLEKCVSTASFSRLVTSSWERRLLTARTARRYSSSWLVAGSPIRQQWEWQESDRRGCFLCFGLDYWGIVGKLSLGNSSLNLCRYPRFSNRLLNLCQEFQLLLCVFKVTLHQLTTDFSWWEDESFH